MQPSSSTRLHGTSIWREATTSLTVLACEALALLVIGFRANEDPGPSVGGLLAGLLLFFAPKYLLLGAARTLRRRTVSRGDMSLAYRWFIGLDLIVLCLMWIVSSEDPLALGALIIEVVWGGIGLLAGLVLATVVLITGKDRTG